MNTLLQRINQLPSVPLIIALLALALAVFAVVRVGFDEPIPLAGEKVTIKVVPASGVQGFMAGPFCADPLTQVRALPAPDASGTTYQLLRVRDLKTETVTVVIGADKSLIVATHYYDSAIGQQSEPAILDEDARSCVLRRAK